MIRGQAEKSILLIYYAALESAEEEFPSLYVLQRQYCPSLLLLKLLLLMKVAVVVYLLASSIFPQLSLGATALLTSLL